MSVSFIGLEAVSAVVNPANNGGQTSRKDGMVRNPSWPDSGFGDKREKSPAGLITGKRQVERHGFFLRIFFTIMF